MSILTSKTQMKSKVLTLIIMLVESIKIELEEKLKILLNVKN